MNAESNGETVSIVEWRVPSSRFILLTPYKWEKERDFVSRACRVVPMLDQYALESCMRNMWRQLMKAVRASRLGRAILR